MSPNKFKPHLLVLPEDEANEKIANGFTLYSGVNNRAIQVLPISDGWKKAVEDFGKDHAPKMRKLPHRNFLLLIDFDKNKNRLSYVKDRIPEELKDRVFVLGSFDEAEDLKEDTKLSSEEKIGEALAKDCAENTNELWGRDLLKHNKTELGRMIETVKPFLFKEVK